MRTFTYHLLTAVLRNPRKLVGHHVGLLVGGWGVVGAGVGLPVEPGDGVAGLEEGLVSCVRVELETPSALRRGDRILL